MSKRRNIKTLLVIYVVSLLAYVLASLYLLQINFSQFQDEIYENSQNNLKVIDTLTKVETSLYIYKNSVQRFMLTGSEKWTGFIKESEQNLSSYFNSLEAYNDNRFNEWVRLESFVADDPIGDLNEVLRQYQESKGDETLFQRLFYLVRYNITKYTQQKKDLITKLGENQADLVEGDDLVVESPEETLQVKTIFTGINQLLNQYNIMFWDYSRQQQGRFERNTRLYYRVFAGVSVFLVFFSLFLFWQVLSHFSKQQSNEENLVLLGTRDMATGLFNRRSFEILIGQELERAKRRGYHLSLLIVKVEPFEQIRQDLGQLSLDRLMFQIAETLRNSCRLYDGIFKYDNDAFILVHPETDLNAINIVVSRFKGTLYKKEFLVKSNQTRVIPKISVGIAIYPTDGVDYPALIKFAMGNLSVDFDAFRSHQIVHVDESFLVSKPKATGKAEGKGSTLSSMDMMFEAPNPQPANDQPIVEITESTPIVEASNDEPVLVEAAAVLSSPEIETPVAVVEEVHAAEVLSPEESVVAEIPVLSVEDSVAVPVVSESLVDEPIVVSPAVLEDDIPDVVAAMFQDEEGVPAIDEGIETKFADVQVVNAEGQDVIMVDFDREKDDLAQKFRKKLLDKRKKS